MERELRLNCEENLRTRYARMCTKIIPLIAYLVNAIMSKVLNTPFQLLSVGIKGHI